MDTSSNIVGQAIEEWVTGLPWEGEGPPNVGVLGDWLAVACFVSVDSQGRPNAQYYLAMRDGSLLPHVAKGLIVEASEQLPGLRNDEP